MKTSVLPLHLFPIAAALLLLAPKIKAETVRGSETIRGSVVSYEPVWNKNKPDIENIQDNVKWYCSYTLQAAKARSDIVVFPAEGLTGTKNKKVPIPVPTVADKADLSSVNDSNHEILSVLSHCAKSAQIYVVATVDELVNNGTCLTQFVFGRDGVLIAKNRGIRCRNNTKVEEEMFTTDKGDKVGLMLNEDIFLCNRTDQMKKAGAKYFALSYDLVGHHPFSTGVQNEWWWSYGHNSVLMAAGLSEKHRSGSGIYYGRNIGLPKLTEGTMWGDRLITHSLPNITEHSPQYSFVWDMPKKEAANKLAQKSRVKRDDYEAEAYAEAYASVEKREIKQEDNFTTNLANYTTLLLNVNYMRITREKERFLMDETLCSGGLCCRFKLKWKVRLVQSDGFSVENLLEAMAHEEDSHNHKSKPGCYLLVVGNTRESLGGAGSGQVKRCALIYSNDAEHCTDTMPIATVEVDTIQEYGRKKRHEQKNNKKISLRRQQTSKVHPLQKSMKTKREIIFAEQEQFPLYQQPLNRSNAVLKDLEIVANDKNLTPNILIDNGIELVPHVKAFVYKDFPASRLYVKKTFHRFITMGIQKVTNYTLH